MNEINKEMTVKEFVNADWDHFLPVGTLLNAAVHSNNIQLVKQTIKFGVDVNKKNSEGLTALFYVERVEIAEELIKAGADPNITNFMGQTPVITIYLRDRKYKSKTDIIRYLIGVTDLDLPLNNGYTLLETMIFNREDDTDLLKLVLINTKNKNKLHDGETLLFHAARGIKYEEIILLLMNSGMDLHFRNNEGKDFYDYCFGSVKKYINSHMPEFIEKRKLKNDCIKYNI